MQTTMNLHMDKDAIRDIADGPGFKELSTAKCAVLSITADVSLYVPDGDYILMARAFMYLASDLMDMYAQQQVQASIADGSPRETAHAVL